MIISMTGYGSGEVSEDGATAFVEIRTVNSRHCEVSARLPRIFGHKEQELKEIVRQKIARGRVNVSVSFETAENKNKHLKIDEELAKKYYRLLEELKGIVSVEETVELSHLLKFSDIITYEENDESQDDSLWELIVQAVVKALDEVIIMRKREGEIIVKDIKTRLEKIQTFLLNIENMIEGSQDEKFDKLKTRIAALIDESSIDPERLEQEIAYLTVKSDITEEIVRFKSHNEVFLSLLNLGKPVGQKLNFLLQEMNREANTIASKSNHAEVSQTIVNTKSEIEKIREQIQNIE